VVGALIVALLVSSAVTALVATRLTRSVLDDQSSQLLPSHLRVLEAAYQVREDTLAVNMRNLAQLLKARNLTAPEHRAELIGELGRAQSNLGLSALRVIDDQGRELSPPAGAGDPLAPMGDPYWRRASDNEPSSRLLPTVKGTFVQAVPVPIGTGPDALILVGGYEFADAFAHTLRRQIGSLDDVIVVAGDRVAASTLAEAPQRPPALAGGGLPKVPTSLEVDGRDRLVAYTEVGRLGDPVRGALGVVFNDPVASLGRELARTRLVASIVLSLVALALGLLLFRLLIHPLVELAGTARRIAAGDTEASFEAKGQDEIGVLARSLEAMRVELRNKIDLVASQAAALRESSQRVVAAQDEERSRLARDLHDGIQQQLVVLRMRLGLLEEGPERPSERGTGNGDGGSGSVTAFETLGRELDGVIQCLREVAQNLYPSILLDRGLAPAVHSYVSRLPVPVRFSCFPDPFPRLAPEIESGVYFLLGEAVTNALKHAEATEMAVDLHFEGEWLVASVQDDGRGFSQEGVQRRGGLLHMQDRARSFGGTVDITSEPGAGTRVVARFPRRTEPEHTWWDAAGGSLAAWPEPAVPADG
jgi:signal transduction histidine kinase